jgi:transaldolase
LERSDLPDHHGSSHLVGRTDHLADKRRNGCKRCGVIDACFEREKHNCGRISIQTNPAYYRNAKAIIDQAVHFNKLAPNIQVKIPATRAGIEAIEEVTYQGVNINATVSFSVSQSLAVAEALEHGLNRRLAEGKDISEMRPACTIMIGRVDDWMQVLIQRDAINVNPVCIHWAGIASLKRAYSIYQKKRYRTQLLGAAFRHHMHWFEFIGGDIILTIPYSWQVQLNKSDIAVTERFSHSVPDDALRELLQNFPDFRRAYEPDGLSIAEFDTFGPTVRTLRAFISSYHDLVSIIREFMLPNPDVVK